jgi:hypothetical protein
MKATFRNRASELGVAERIVAILTFESWKTHLVFVLFHTTEEVLKRCVGPPKNILPDLGIDFAHFGQLAFQLGQFGHLPGHANGMATIPPRGSALFD